MVILKLLYNDSLSIYKKLLKLRDELKNQGIVIGLVESQEYKTHIIKIICDDDKYNDKIKEITSRYISNILYRVVINNYKQKEMLEFITDNYFFLNQSEIIQVEELITRVLNLECTESKDDNIYCINRINSIIDKINDCINENKEINVDGFITFRMRNLTKDIEQIIDKVIEMFMIEKEYNEFIKLLKYFVNLQECKVDEVNLVFEDGDSYLVNDKYGNNLYEQFLEELNGENHTCDVKNEDVIISGLITVSPNKIIIHNKDKCRIKEFLDTIINVFADRVIFENNTENIIDKTNVCLNKKC